MINGFIKRLQDDWNDILPGIKDIAIKELTSNFNEIDFTKTNLIDIPKEFGVYLFQIFPLMGFSLEEFQKEWRANTSPKYSPNISNSRVPVSVNSTWYPFYIGKSEALLSRINEHCFQASEKTTYGLKLKHRKNLLDKAKFSYSYYSIAGKTIFDKHVMQFVITNLEREIRNQIEPWIGKQ